MFNVGDKIGIVKLKNTYDLYVFMVIGHCLKKQVVQRTKVENGRSRRLPATYEVVANMPNLSEYQELKRKRFTDTADKLMEQAYGEISNLAEEMRSWYDNLPEGLRSSSRGEAIDETANDLERISPQNSIELMTKINVYHLPELDESSRSKRATEVSSILRDVSSAIQGYLETQKIEDVEDTELKEALNDLEFIQNQCDDDAEMLEQISFPTMFG